MKKILIFSDSHGNNEKILEISKKERPDLVLHAGDYCCDSVELSKFVNYFCAGNNDYPTENGINGQKIVEFEYENLKFLITHSDEFSKFTYDINFVEKEMAKTFRMKNLDVIVYGHSHIDSVNEIYGTLLINPGSITYPRNSQNRKSYAILEIEDGKIHNKEKIQIIRYL